MAMPVVNAFFGLIDGSEAAIPEDTRKHDNTKYNTVSINTF